MNTVKKKDTELLIKLIEERDRYLSENPHLRSYQAEINKILDEVGDDPVLRTLTLIDMMSETITEDLAPELLKLNKLLDQATEPDERSTSTNIKYKKTSH